MKLIFSIILFITSLYPQNEWLILNKNNSPIISNKVYNSVQDIDGNYYINTNQSFFKLSPPNNWVRLDTLNSVFTTPPFRLFKDKFNTIWAAGDNLYYLKNGIWIEINDSLPSNDGISAIAVEDTNTIWCGTYYNGLYKYDFNQWIKVGNDLFNYEINQIIIDSSNSKWIAMDDGGGLVKLTGSDTVRIYHPDFISPASGWTSTNGLLIDKENQNKLLITAEHIMPHTNTNFLAEYDMANDNWTLYDSAAVNSRVLPSKLVLTNDQNNKKWIGTMTTGILTFDNGTFNFITKDNSGLPENTVWSLMIDSYNNKWISGYPNYGIAIFNENGIVNITSVDYNFNSTQDFQLYQNYPNPFNPFTKISYQIPQQGFVTLKIFDVLGREIATLVNEEKPEGRYEVNFSSKGIASGVYIYRMKVNDFIESKKMILLR